MFLEYDGKRSIWQKVKQEEWLLNCISLLFGTSFSGYICSQRLVEAHYVHSGSVQPGLGQRWLEHNDGTAYWIASMAVRVQFAAHEGLQTSKTYQWNTFNTSNRVLTSLKSIQSKVTVLRRCLTWVSYKTSAAVHLRCDVLWIPRL